IQHIHRDPIFIFILYSQPTTTATSTLSLHDALPICPRGCPANRDSINYDIATAWHLPMPPHFPVPARGCNLNRCPGLIARQPLRSEEHTSELQSRFDLVCRLLLEKKKKISVPRQFYC